MSTCSYYTLGPTKKLEDEKLEKYRSWAEFKKLEEILAKFGTARVYLVATSCGMNSPKSTLRKIRDFAEAHKGVRAVELEHEEWASYPKRSRKAYTPALTAVVNNAGVFVRLWEEANKIRARGCGCSVFISDGQAIDVRVMDPNYVSGSEYAPHRTALDIEILREWV